MAGDARRAFAAAADAYVSLVASIDPGRFGDPATPSWTVLELVAHSARAFLVTETVLAAPVDDSIRLLDGPAAYFGVAMSSPGVHAGIEQRARDGVAALGADPAAAMGEIAERVLATVAATPDDRIVQHAAGRIAFVDFLATRVLELTLHSVDLQVALGAPIQAPASAAVVTRDVVVALVDRADALSVACVLTGRPAPGACNVLG